VLREIKALLAAEQERLVRLLAEETDWLEDAMDAAIAKARIDEPERPVEMLLREQGLGIPRLLAGVGRVCPHRAVGHSPPPERRTEDRSALP